MGSLSIQAGATLAGGAGPGTALSGTPAPGGSAAVPSESAGRPEFAAVLAEASALQAPAGQGETGQERTGSAAHHGEEPPPQAGDAGTGAERRDGPVAVAQELALAAAPAWAVGLQAPQAGGASAPNAVGEAPVTPLPAGPAPAGTGVTSGLSGSAGPGFFQAGSSPAAAWPDNPLPGGLAPHSASPSGDVAALSSVLLNGPAAQGLMGTQGAFGRFAYDPVRSNVEPYLRALGWNGTRAGFDGGRARGQAKAGAAAGAPGQPGLAWPLLEGQHGTLPDGTPDAGVDFTTAAAAGRVGHAPRVRVASEPRAEGAFIVQGGDGSGVPGSGAGPGQSLAPAGSATELAQAIRAGSTHGAGLAADETAGAQGFRGATAEPGAAVVTGRDGPGSAQSAVRHYTVAPISRPGRVAAEGGTTAWDGGSPDGQTPGGGGQARAFTAGTARSNGAAPGAPAGGAGQGLHFVSDAEGRARQEEPAGGAPDRAVRALVKQGGPSVAEQGAFEAVSGSPHVQAGEDPQTFFREAARLVASHVTRWIEQAPSAAYRRGEVVAARIAQDGTEIRLQLHPPEMGELRLVLNSEGSQLTVHVVARQADTGQLLRQHAGLLQQALEQAGLHLAGFSVEVGHHAMGGQHAPLPWFGSQAGAPAGAWARPSDGELMATVREEPAWVRLGMAAVDVRV